MSSYSSKLVWASICSAPRDSTWWSECAGLACSWKVKRHGWHRAATAHHFHMSWVWGSLSAAPAKRDMHAKIRCSDPPQIRSVPSPHMRAIAMIHSFTYWHRHYLVSVFHHVEVGLRAPAPRAGLKLFWKMFSKNSFSTLCSLSSGCSRGSRAPLLLLQLCMSLLVDFTNSVGWADRTLLAPCPSTSGLQSALLHGASTNCVLGNLEDQEW
jgi:hypothetical protein